ncbi:MAG: hypothetical protein P8I45_00820, partial [Nitrospinaceae bacterium]|nr:hypothetical protein [Nitrospinaceae bacterium]
PITATLIVVIACVNASPRYPKIFNISDDLIKKQIPKRGKINTKHEKAKYVNFFNFGRIIFSLWFHDLSCLCICDSGSSERFSSQIRRSGFARTTWRNLP